jgi:hypothetical protein
MGLIRMPLPRIAEALVHAVRRGWVEIEREV